MYLADVPSMQQDDFPKPGLSRPTLKRRVLHRAQQALYLSGLASLYAKLSCPNGALILMYHSVVDKEISVFIDPNNSVTVEQFSSQLQFLKQHCNVISLAKMLAHIQENKPLPERSVVITFDDGYRDNLTLAAPLLEKYQLPATLFLCTGYVERAETQWIDQLYTAFQFRTQHDLKSSSGDKRFNLLSETEMQQAYLATVQQLLTAGLDKRTEILQQVKTQLQPKLETPRLTLNWDEVRQLKDNYPQFELGLHTRDHMDLAMLNQADIETEIKRCQLDYEQELSAKARFFSYPYGRNNETIRAQAKAAGFEGAVITQPTALVKTTTDQYALPRLETSDSILDLRLWTSGAFPALAKNIFGRVYE